MAASGDIDTVVAPLREVRAIDGILAFGSYARDDLRSGSDVDLLVLCGSAGQIGHARERVRARADALDHPLSAMFFTEQSLLEEFRRRPSFAAHLADEAVFLQCRGSCRSVRAWLERYVPPPSELEDELRRELTALDLFRDTSRMNGHYLTSLAQLYSIARSVTIIKLLQNGVHQYGWREIFARLADLKPALHVTLESLAGLRPYYEYLTQRRDAAPDGLLPRGQRMTDDAVRTMVQQIVAVAATR